MQRAQHNSSGIDEEQQACESQTLADLIARLRDGDAQAAAEFIERSGPVLRAHFRRRIGRSMRRLVDSQDLLSTIARRLCQRVAVRGVRAESPEQLWALVYRMGNDALIDHIRIVERLNSIEAEHSPFVLELQERLVSSQPDHKDAFALELKSILDTISSPTDKELLVLWLHGHSLADAGELLGLKPAAARQRWHRMRLQIQKCWQN